MSTPTFKLTVDGLELTLVEFDGVEEMNRLFKYTFTAETPTTGEKLIDVIDGDAIFTIEEYDTSLHTGNIEIPGYISKASKSNGFWILEFSPKLLKTTTNSRAEIYFKEDDSLTALTVIDSEFQNDILLNDRVAVFDITATLPTRKLFCQLHESNFNFVARLCDHWGFHFYFDHFLTKIVFADNNLYDQVFTTELKTTNATADNSPLKIINWQEEVKALESYTTIIGHDHANAGTPITASSPSDSGSQGTLTETRLTFADVNSQVEADYIAQIRQESKNGLNHNASGESKIPYIFPGFLIDTDDTDFAKAFVISTVSSGRNLNSSNSGNASSFTCKFRAIPDSVCFRPNAFYPHPIATNVIGRIISETSNVNQAQRNGTGEYKAELIGFENETSVHPWLRKAQTTASTNSVDIPLTPNTEVVIAFLDNNPNCPYIEHALHNSLHPAPVTNANPHHAIIGTDGMLVTSSLLGRQNFSTTGNHTATVDGTISGTIKNYFTDRGAFDQHTNFIDPSTTALDFSHDDESSGNYIFTRHYGDSVEIHEGDKLHWHNGNLYDFGGYWNYNLGNSYEENFIDQAAPLNTKVNKDSRSGDILTAGPNPGAISFSTLAKNGLSEADVKPASYSNTGVATTDASKTFKVNSEGAWDANGMNITKDYNATYDYKFGEGIEVSDRVNSLEITHTDATTTAIEMNFNAGILRSWDKTVGRTNWTKSWNGSGTKTAETYSDGTTSEETNWHSKGSNHKSSDSKTTKNESSITTDSKTYNINTGALATHNITKSDGMGASIMDFSYQETNKAAFNFGGERSFSISAQGAASIAISLSGSAAINIGFGLAFELKTGVEAGMSLDLRTGIDIGINSKGKLEVSGIGFKARAETRADARKEGIKLRKAEMDLDSKLMSIEDKQLDLETAVISIASGMQLTGL
ncbi:MAG: contractile injection system protein, VgrG/Pvc8 family [Oleispira sp.]